MNSITRAPAATSQPQLPDFDREREAAKATEASRLVTVPFHGSDLFVVDHDGEPYTPMRPIVRGMGLDWASQYTKITSHSARWGVVEITIPTEGMPQRMVCIPLRKVFGWLAGLNIGKIRPELREKVAAYQDECDDVLWRYWNEGLAVNPRAGYSVQPDQTLTDEEAETLRLMLKTAADRAPRQAQGKLITQGWSKLKAHFGVSYRQIPRHEFSEAVSILARHAADWEVVDEVPALPAPGYTPANCDSAMELASAVGAKVTAQVFKSVLARGGEWQFDRWAVSLVPTATGRPIEARVTLMGPKDRVISTEAMIHHITAPNDSCFRRSEVAAIAQACVTRLGMEPPRPPARA